MDSDLYRQNNLFKAYVMKKWIPNHKIFLSLNIPSRYLYLKYLNLQNILRKSIVKHTLLTEQLVTEPEMTATTTSITKSLSYKGKACGCSTV